MRWFRNRKRLQTTSDDPQPCQRRPHYVPCGRRGSNIRRTTVFARRRAAAPRAASALGSHIRCVVFRSSCTHSLIPLYKVRFLITWEAVEHEGPYVFIPFIYLFMCPARAQKITHIVANTIHYTCRTSARYFPYSPNMASRHSSHCTRTSGRAMPAGPAHPHGRLSR